MTWLCCLLCGGSLMAQELIASAGQTASGSSVQLSYSLGEVATASLAGSVILTQGFQQPYVTTTRLREAPPLALAVFPNPVTDRLYLTLPPGGHYEVRLYDVRGRLLRDLDWPGLVPALDVGDLATGLYTLVVRERRAGAVARAQIQKS